MPIDILAFTSAADTSLFTPNVISISHDARRVFGLIIPYASSASTDEKLGASYNALPRGL
jgi:hypothetical protein